MNRTRIVYPRKQPIFNFPDQLKSRSRRQSRILGSMLPQEVREAGIVGDHDNIFNPRQGLGHVVKLI